MRFGRLMAVAASLLIAVVTGAIFLAGRPKNDPIHRERAKLTGTWQMVSGENDGAKASERAVREHKFTFTSEGAYATTAGERELSKGEYALDPDKTPKSVEFWPELPRSAVGKVLKREIRSRFWDGHWRAV